MPMLDADTATFRAIEELKRIYKNKVLPLEHMYRFEEFYTQSLSDAEFDAKPQVLLIGQYSVGKTTFIKNIVGRDFPGSRIGPEPTTDKFMVVLYGRDDRIIPGNSLSLKKDLPYKGLEKFGVQFLNRFEGSQVASESLRNVNLIDTPGVLTGEKQKTMRPYNYVEVVGWFTERADLVIVLFDSVKLDLSDEFKEVLEIMLPHQEKLRCVLNKADQVDKQRLLRVYGALMWNLGRIMKTPEATHVYVGSFWDQPLVYDDNAALFQAEQRDLMKELGDLPRNSAVRKINDLVKRIRLCKVHSYIIGYLKDQLPTFGKKKKMIQLIDNLDMVFETVAKKYNLNLGDFPPVQTVQDKLRDMDFSKFSRLKTDLIDGLDEVLLNAVPRLLESLPGINSTTSGADTNGADNLLALLGPGLLVIKHGRKGSPKERLLRCNPAVTRIYWSRDLHSNELPDDSKSIGLRDIIELRRGSDPDPDHAGLYGTPTLRRHPPKPSELDLCLSLVLRNRTVDLQCHTNDDFMSLFSNIQRQCIALRNPAKKAA